MLLDVEEMLDSTLNNIFKKYDVDYQIKQAHSILKDQWNKIDGISLFYKEYFIYICICNISYMVVLNQIIFLNRTK